MSLYSEDNGENPPYILLLHDGFSSGWMCDNQLEALNNCHLIIPDLLVQVKKLFLYSKQNDNNRKANN